MDLKKAAAGFLLMAATLPASPHAGAQHRLNALPGAGAQIIDVFSLPVLRALEQTHRFGQMLGGTIAPSLAQLYNTNARYRSVADRLIADLAFMRKQIVGRVDHSHGFVIRDMVYNSAEAYGKDREGDTPRQLNPAWFRSKFARFRLVALVNRPDKVDTDPDGCGEVRLIYRLAYRVPDRRGKPRYYAVLPVLFNLVMEYPKAADCSIFAKRWQVDQPPASAAAYADWLRRGPLAAPLRFKQLEVNLQSLRFTAGYMKDIGGQAMYILRVLRPAPDDPARLVPAPLENVPDVVALRRDAALRRQLMAHLAQPAALAALDQGTIVLPNIGGRLLARIAISFSTLGRARLANKPYSDLLTRSCAGEKDREARAVCWRGLRKSPWTGDARSLAGKIDHAKLGFLKSFAAVADRLDNRTCMGCHQSGGTAGFHILGMTDDKLSDPFNQFAVPYSAHYFAERARRIAYLKAVIEGRPPNRFRPHSFHPAGSWPTAAGNAQSAPPPRFRRAQVKEACLPSAAHYAGGLPCAGGSVCSVTVKNPRLGVTFGECAIARVRGGNGKPDNRSLFSGHACRTGTIENADRFDRRAPDLAAFAKAGLPFNFLDFRDYFRQGARLYSDLRARRRGALYSCRPTDIGVPLGRTYRRCTSAERSLRVFDEIGPEGRPASRPSDLAKGRYPEEYCALVGGTAFERCAATNDVLTCLKAAGIARGMLDACWPGRFCREDYICQRLPLDAARSDRERAVIRALHRRHIGFCTPTYFVFNMRSDGHPDPVTGIARSDRPRTRVHRGGFDKRFGRFRWRNLLR